MNESNFLHGDITQKIIGSAMEVYNTLGTGFLESVYAEAMAHELVLQKLSFEREFLLNVHYKGKLLKQFNCDLLVENAVIVELKAIKKLTDIEKAQLINYLKASGIKVGLLLNFGSTSLEYKRLVY